MRRLPALLLVAFFPIASSAGVRSVDFRFAPSNSFSLISFPEDWLKSVVTRAGALGYDFGPGPYARPLTTISIEAEEESLAVERQWLPEGRVPIVRTRLRGDAITSEQVVFATIPEQRHSAPHVTQGRVSRLGPRNGCRAWATPLLPCDPLFRSVAWGTNRPRTGAGSSSFGCASRSSRTRARRGSFSAGHQAPAHTPGRPPRAAAK